MYRTDCLPCTGSLKRRQVKSDHQWLLAGSNQVFPCPAIFAAHFRVSDCIARYLPTLPQVGRYIPELGTVLSLSSHVRFLILSTHTHIILFHKHARAFYSERCILNSQTPKTPQCGVMHKRRHAYSSRQWQTARSFMSADAQVVVHRRKFLPLMTQQRSCSS